MRDIKPKMIFGLFNTRPLVVGFFYLAAGIILAVYRPPFVAIWFCVVALSALYLYIFKALTPQTLTVVLVCLCLSISVFALRAILDKKLCFDTQATVEGRVLSMEEVDDEYIVLLDDIEINGVEYFGKMRVHYKTALELGDRFRLKGSLKTYSLSDEVNGYVLRRVCYREYYDLYATSSVKKEEGNLPFREMVVNYVYDGISENADMQTAGFAISVLFGRSEKLESLSAYREVNLAHLFAVSGLHVGTLTAIFYFVLIKVLKKKKYTAVAISALALILLFYAYLCDFTPSVIRSLILALAAALLIKARIFPDRASILSLAAILSLTFSPLWLFDVSFILSYGAVLGIIVLQPLFARIFSKLPLPKFLRDALSLNLSVSFSVMPISAYFFGEASLLSLPLSLVYIPFVSLLYVCFLVLFPFVGLSFTIYPLVPLSLGVKLCDVVVAWFDKTDAYFVMDYGLISLACWFCALFILSDFCILPTKRKILASLCSVSAAAVWLLT